MSKLIALKAESEGVKYPLTLVNWIDSSFQNGWRFIEQTTERLNTCTSVGFKKEGEDYIVLYPHISNNDMDSFQGSGIIVIPKCSILNQVQIYSNKDHLKH